MAIVKARFLAPDSICGVSSSGGASGVPVLSSEELAVEEGEPFWCQLGSVTEAFCGWLNQM